MKLGNVSLLTPRKVEVRVRTGNLPDLEVDEEIEVRFGESSDLVEVCIRGGESATVEGVTSGDKNRLWDLEQQGLRTITIVRADVLDDESRRLALDTYSFTGDYVWPDLCFGFAESLALSVVPKRRQSEPDAAASWFQDEFCLENSLSRFLVTRIPGRHSERSAFRLLGEAQVMDIQSDAQGRFQVTRVFRRRKQEVTDAPIVLIQARLSVVTPENASVVTDLQWEEADASLGLQQTYLSLWERYNDLELQLTLESMGEFGQLRYDKVVPHVSGGYRLHLTRSVRTQGQCQQMEREVGRYQVDVSDDPPVNLVGPDQTGVSDAVRQWVKSTRAWTGVVQSVDSEALSVVIMPVGGSRSLSPAPQGFVYPSVSGDVKQTERRRRAYESIRTGTSAMPTLFKLLEGTRSSARRRHRLTVKESLVQDVFGGPPTERQREALMTALNTPDIALIQGPPGTGKTRVIAALQQLIAHHHKVGPGGAMRAVTLVTSGQHDAVENVASAIEVYGLPAVKIGKGQRQTVDTVSENIERWRLDRADDIRASLAAYEGGDQGPEGAIRRLQALLEGYVSSPHVNEQPLDLIRQALALARSFLDSATVNQVEARIARVSQARPTAAGDEDLDDALVALRRLRTTSAAFEDDGSRQARNVLRELYPLNVLNQQETELLEYALHAENEPGAVDLDALSTLKVELLTRLTSGRGLPDVQPVQAGETEMVGTILTNLYDRATTTEATVEGALQRYLDDLTFDPEGIREAVERYTMVLASTCQQSVSGEMFRQKEKDNTFNTVIVDEAARVSPLDLLIPMSLARQSIVLVGDHRQLPHLLEPQVEQRLGDESAPDVLKLSLFERLFVELKARQLQDQIPRVVTLDTQYRMHPTLGNFLSRTFYEAYGEGFASGRPAADFVHRLPGYEGRCAAWLDVPHPVGPEKRRGTSYARPVEADAVAAEVASLFRWMREHDEWYSVGVIAFYSAQVPELWRALAALDLAETDREGQYSPKETYRTVVGANGRRKEGLRVGTVDAFQGKEFDVVLVSVTRSNAVVPTSPRDVRSKYGHLVLPNRLCVAMSRQHRLLVLCGDLSMVTEQVPALQRFVELVQLEGQHAFS